MFPMVRFDSCEEDACSSHAGWITFGTFPVNQICVKGIPLSYTTATSGSNVSIRVSHSTIDHISLLKGPPKLLFIYTSGFIPLMVIFNIIYILKFRMGVEQRGGRKGISIWGRVWRRGRMIPYLRRGGRWARVHRVSGGSSYIRKG